MTPHEFSRSSRRTGAAFTLVELLIVVAIVGLLLAVLLPSLDKARALAREALCGQQLNTYGKQVAIYVNDYHSYPPMGDSRYGPAWPKFYGVLHAMDIQVPWRQRGMFDYSQWEADEVWEKCFCPAMDYVGILQAADKALVENQSPAYKPALHRAAAGYQWNSTLRAAGPPTTVFPSGRWPNECWRPTGGGWDNTYWMDYTLSLPGSAGYCIAQAILPQEIDRTAIVAEAWDSFDFESIPNLNVPYGAWAIENMVPGWHVGPQSSYTNGWAILNGARHPRGPNILYADGHVRPDADKELTESDLSGGGLPYGGTDGQHSAWYRCRLRSWSDYDQTFGTMHHIVPVPRIIASP